MLEAWGDENVAAVVGLGGGILLGLAARLGRFCTLGAIEDFLYGNNDLRLRRWGLAIATAIIGSFGLMAAGAFDPTESFYISGAWSPAASIIGGLIFGYGMAIAGNCGFGALARLGGGDLRSFVIVLVMGMAAYATISGPLAPLRLAVFGNGGVATEPTGIAHLIGGATGISIPLAGLLIGLAIALAVLANADFIKDKRAVFWSAVVGLAVVMGWAGMQFIHDTGFSDLPIVGHTFSAPLGEAILYGMTSSARTLSFGIGSVAGVWIGAFIGSLIKGHFRWEACEDPRELRRQIFGAGMMGVGAVIALGCSIGQGLSAFSILAFSAPVTFAAIFAGAAVGLRHIIMGFAPAE
ncbi:YeeE/YedE family protein [Yoonia sp.]|uniref:YeeE/YedE family protein n=1 Tax=Yoonia sp. TaxID=2212373 RepID=UPI003F6BD8F0